MEESQSKKEKVLVKNTVLYAVSNFGTKIFTFLLVPLYTHYLSTSEYGTYDTIHSMVNLVAPMCILAIHEGVLRWLLKSDDSDNTVVSTGLTLYLLLIGITDVLLIVFYQIWKWEYTWLFIFCLTSATFFSIMQFIARGAKKNLLFALSGIIQTLVMLCLNIVLIIVLKWGMSGLLVSLAVSQIVAAGFILLNMQGMCSIHKYCFSKRLAKQMLLYSVMLVPNNISWWVMSSSDRLMLTSLLGSEFTGVYSIACKFPTILNSIHTLFYRAWQEQAVIEYDSKSRDEYYSKVFNIYMRFGFCFALLLVPLSKIYIKLTVNTAYQEAYKYLGVLMLGTLFCAFSGFYGTGYVSAKDTKNASLTTGIGAVVNCIINVVFIKSMGIWAACISTLIGYFVTWLVRIKQTKKYFIINVNKKEFTILLVISILYCIIVTFQDNVSTYILLAISILICFVVNKKLIIQVLKKIRTT